MHRLRGKSRDASNERATIPYTSYTLRQRNDKSTGKTTTLDRIGALGAVQNLIFKRNMGSSRQRYLVRQRRLLRRARRLGPSWDISSFCQNSSSGRFPTSIPLDRYIHKGCCRYHPLMRCDRPPRIARQSLKACNSERDMLRAMPKDTVLLQQERQGGIL